MTQLLKFWQSTYKKCQLSAGIFTSKSKPKCFDYYALTVDEVQC